MIYKKLLILPCLVLLNGCFMYNNIKCAVNGDCDPEVIELTPEEIKAQKEKNEEHKRQIKQEKKETEKYTQKAKKMIAERCVLFGWKKGTAKYVSCNKARFDVFEGEVYFKYNGSHKKAYSAMASQYKNDENTCVEYGVSRGTQAFKECQVQLEQDEIKRQMIANQSEKERINRKLSEPISVPVNCRSYTAFGQTYTQCY